MKKAILTYSVLCYLLAFSLIACNGSSSSDAKETTSFSFETMSIAELQAYYKDGTFSVVEITEAYLDRIHEIDIEGPALNSIIQINPDAIAIAEQLDEELKNGASRGPLHGVPVILKDNIDTHDNMFTTAGSRALAGSKPLQDSYVAKQLKAAGALIIAKANLSEWANFRGQMSSSGWSGINGCLLYTSDAADD